MPRIWILYQRIAIGVVSTFLKIKWSNLLQKSYIISRNYLKAKSILGLHSTTMSQGQMNLLLFQIRWIYNGAFCYRQTCSNIRNIHLIENDPHIPKLMLISTGTLDTISVRIAVCAIAKITAKIVIVFNMLRVYIYLIFIL